MSDFNCRTGARVRRVRVHLHGKRLKELSSLYAGQEFQGHEGSILTMKFGPDGQYLATASEDGTVHVWKVVEDEKPKNFDPSSLHFSADHSPKLSSLDMDKNITSKMKRLRKSSVSASAIFPPKVFRILEKPLHKFHGHSSECLLSSSVDKTVRLWQVGHSQCLRVFSHNNYVTCVEFNPTDDNYFISGSIDGKLRIWEVGTCQIVDWTDIREIVTALCFSPNGKRGMVGSMDGNCRFYDIIDNCLRLDAQIRLQGKKKQPCKRIIGFQFFPSDSNIVMVTSADSQVGILNKANVICKFKGIRNSGSLVPASFTSDGKHVVWASEDCNVYIWNYIRRERISSGAKSIWSCEKFLSHNSSIALPWCGMDNSVSESPMNLQPVLENGLHHKLPLAFADCFSLSRGFFSESLPKGSATSCPQCVNTSTIL